MTEMSLVLPAIQHENFANDFKKEFFGNGESVINGSALFDQMEYRAWLENTKKNSSPATVQPNWVVATTFFAVRKSDEKLIGMIDIRHSLDNQLLAEYGGHIGYSILPSERRKGYATQMLKLALDYAKTLNLKKVMLGCKSNNIASQKTIVKCGGKLTEQKPYVDGTPVNIYWIDL